jgi:hypothetical protein
MLDWQTRDILITEREFGKRRTATAPASAGTTGTTATLLWMAVRPGSTESSGAVFTCPSLPAATQPATAALPTATRPATTQPATAASLSSARLQSEWASATNFAAFPAACKGYGRVAGLWSGYGIPVFQRAPAISALATASPGAITAIARGSHAPGTAPHEFQLIWPDFT